MTSPAGNQVAYIDGYRVDLPAGDPLGIAAYRKVLEAVFEFEVPPSAGGSPFFAHSEVFCLPDVTVSRTRSSASRFTRTIRTIAQGATDQILVVCYLSGHFTIERAGKAIRVEAGRLAFIDLAQEIVIEAPAVDNVSLAISRRRLEALLPFLDDAHGLVCEPGALPSVLIGMMQTIMSIGSTMPVVDSRAIAGATIQLAAACIETRPRAQAETSPGRGTVSLLAVKAAIERRLTDPDLRPQALLDELGITRSTLYRLFEPLGGVRVYILERRLHHAFRLMVDPAEPGRRISQLAFELGFSHPSAFTRAFKELFGLSPKDVRALAAQSKERDAPLMPAPEVMPYLSPILPAPEAPRMEAVA